MSRPAYERVDEAVWQVRGWAAVLDLIQGHFHENQIASKTMAERLMPKDYVSGHDFHMLTYNESLAFSFAMTEAIRAADELGEAWGELPDK